MGLFLAGAAHPVAVIAWVAGLGLGLGRWRAQPVGDFADGFDSMHTLLIGLWRVVGLSVLSQFVLEFRTWGCLSEPSHCYFGHFRLIPKFLMIGIATLIGHILIRHIGHLLPPQLRLIQPALIRLLIGLLITLKMHH